MLTSQGSYESRASSLGAEGRVFESRRPDQQVVGNVVYSPNYGTATAGLKGTLCLQNPRTDAQSPEKVPNCAADSFSLNDTPLWRYYLAVSLSEIGAVCGLPQRTGRPYKRPDYLTEIDIEELQSRPPQPTPTLTVPVSSDPIQAERQRLFLDYHAWSLWSQGKVRAGIFITAAEAYRMKSFLADQDRRDLADKMVGYGE